MEDGMRVPQRIQLSGTHDDDSIMAMNGYMNVVQETRSEMRVPEKIILAGQEQHISSRGHPRELVLESALMPLDPSVTIQTPPRVITLNEQTFRIQEEEERDSNPVSIELRQVKSQTEEISVVSTVDRSLTRSQSVASLSGASEGNVTEELDNLRRQVSRMNRRLMSLELENQQRQQRELVVYTVGLAYIVMKALLWLNRS